MKISYLILFLVILSTWRMHFVGDKKLSSQHLPVLPGRNHDDTVVIASLDGTIHLVERNSWKVRCSFSSGPALCSSYQTLRWGKDDTKSLINGDYSIECGDDWNLYVRKRTLDKVEPTRTMSKYVDSSPHYLKGMIVLGHRDLIVFTVDARTGRVKSAVTTDANEQYLIKKDMGESTNMPADELLITRTNYKLHSYFRDTLEPAWNVTVGYIMFMHHCLSFGKTYNGDDGMAFPCGVKGVVHRSHEHNPLHFAVKSLDSRNEDEVIFLLPQHSSSSTLNMSPDQLEKGANDYKLKFLVCSSFLIIGLLARLRKIIAGLLGYRWWKNHVQPNRQPSGLNEKRKGTMVAQFKGIYNLKTMGNFLRCCLREMPRMRTMVAQFKGIYNLKMRRNFLHCHLRELPRMRTMVAQFKGIYNSKARRSFLRCHLREMQRMRTMVAQFKGICN